MDNTYAIKVLECLRKKVLVPSTPYYEVVSFCIQLLKRADEKPQGECCGSCYLCDIGNCEGDKE